MTTFKRFALALAAAALLPLAPARAQRPQVSTVNVTPEEGRVRVSAVGGAFGLRVEVTDEAGDTVFEAAQVSDKGLDWPLTGAGGRRVAPGAYTVTASYATPSGKVRKRIEQVLVTEEVKGDEKEAAVAAAPNPQPLLDGGGAVNRIPKFTDADSLTSSAIMDVSGRVGIGTAAAPAAGLRLEVNGATRLTPGGTGGYMQFGTPNTETGLTWSKGTTSRADIRFNGAKLTLAAGTGAGVPSNTGLVITTAGNVGIGVPSPATAKLMVDGGSSIYAIYGYGNTGIYGTSTVDGGIAVFADGRGGNANDKALYAASTGSPNGYLGHAGYFVGNVLVAGTLKVNQGCTGCTTPVSDRALKANFSAIDTRSVLDRLASIPITAWNYKSDSPSVRHIGPMAQDFRAAFNLGADDKHIDLIDANGVTMAAIQGLYRQSQELVAEVRRLRAQLLSQQAQLNQVRRAVRRKGLAKR